MVLCNKNCFPKTSTCLWCHCLTLRSWHPQRLPAEQGSFHRLPTTAPFTTSHPYRSPDKRANDSQFPPDCSVRLESYQQVPALAVVSRGLAMPRRRSSRKKGIGSDRFPVPRPLPWGPRLSRSPTAPPRGTPPTPGPSPSQVASRRPKSRLDGPLPRHLACQRHKGSFNRKTTRKNLGREPRGT